MGNILRQQISKGVFVNTLITEKFKTSCMSIALVMPISCAKGAFSAVLPHVLRRGSKNYPDMQKLSSKLDDLFGARIEPIVRKNGEVLSIGFVADVIDSSYAKGENLTAEVVTLLTQLVFCPNISNNSFQKEVVESEKNNLRDALGAQMNDKRSFANRRLHEIMCKNEAFSKNELGTLEEIDSITHENLYEHYKYVLENARIEIFYCGSDKSVVEQFKEISINSDRNVLELNTEIIKKSTEVNRVSEEFKVAQSKLSLGFRTSVTIHDEDYFALMVANTIFGASTNSKLFVNVREKMSLCYYASASLEKLKGIMTVSSGVETDKLQIAETAILQELLAVQKGDFSEDDIISAKKTLCNMYRSLSDSPIALEAFIMSNVVGSADVTAEEIMENIKKITKEDIVRVSNYLTLDTVYILKGGENNA